MTGRVLDVAGVLLAVLAVGAGATQLRVVDDLGDAIESPLDLCFTIGLEQRCEDAPAGGRFVWPDGASELRAEGDRHGPLRLSRVGLRELKRNEVAVPRKIRWTVSGLGDESAELFLYALDDPLFRRPSERIPLVPDGRGQAQAWLPAGGHLLSVSRAGLAPHLELIEAPPGDRAETRYRAKAGWSLVLRSVDLAGEPIVGASIEIEETALADTETAPARWTTQTGSTGLALVSGLTASLAHAEATHAAYLPAAVYGLASSPGSFAVRTVEHTRGARIDGSVTVDGEPARGIAWSLAPFDGDRRDWRRELEPVTRGTTSPDGTFAAEPLVPGRYVVALEPAGDGSTYLELVRLAADETHRARYDLSPSRVSGEVLRGDSPIEGFQVTLMPGGRELGHRTVEVSDSDRTDDEGIFELTSWQTGSHMVTVRAEDGTSASIRLVELFGVDEEIVFRLPAHPVTGDVVDQAGEPVAEATVVLAGPASGGANVMKTTTSDEAGRFRAFWDLDSDIELHAVKAGFAPSAKVGRRVDWDEPSPPVRLTLERRTTLSGRVTGPTGAGLAGARVWKVARTDVPRVVGEATTGPDGRFDIVAEAAGEVGSLWVSGPGCPLVSVPSVGVDETVEIRCATAPGVLVVHMTDTDETTPLVGRSLLLRQATAEALEIVPRHVLSLHLSHHGLPSVSDGTGTLVLPLAPGQYDLYLAGASSAESIARNLAHGYLGRVSVDAGATAEVEVVEREPSR